MPQPIIPPPGIIPSQEAVTTQRCNITPGRAGLIIRPLCNAPGTEAVMHRRLMPKSMAITVTAAAIMGIPAAIVRPFIALRSISGSGTAVMSVIL